VPGKGKPVKNTILGMSPWFYILSSSKLVFRSNFANRFLGITTEARKKMGKTVIYWQRLTNREKLRKAPGNKTQEPSLC
jgi:hypothetical protein